MKTSSYFIHRGLGRIGISLGTPRRIPAGYRLYRTLAPRRDMLRLPYGHYRDIFFRDILGPLDPQKVADELQRLAGEYDPVIICFERPPFDANNWCHRRMVAEWFGDTLGLDVPELEQTITEDLTHSMNDCS